MTKAKKLSEVPILNDEALDDFWDKHEPEDFGDWEEGSLDFRRPLKKLIQLRLDPGDVRIIDLQNYRSSRPATQIVMSQDTNPAEDRAAFLSFRIFGPHSVWPVRVKRQ